MKSKIEKFAIRHADFVIRWRWAVIALTLLTVFAAGSGAPRLEFANNYRVFFSDENPELNAFEEFQNTYTKNDNIMFVVQPKTKKVFSGDITGALEELTEAAWQIPYAIRVDSITNFQYSWADGDDLTVDDLIRDGPALSPGQLNQKQKAALEEPILRDNLISPDVKTTGINVTLQYPEKTITEVPEAAAKAREITAQLTEKYPDLHIALTGISMMNNAFAESGQKDAGTLMPIMYLVLIVIMIFTLRSFTGTLTTFFVIMFSMITAMGLAGYAGIKLTPMSIMAPTIIMTLAIADSIHILISMIAGMREGQDKMTALKDSIRINFLPVTVTSLTTVIGFLTLNFSEIPPFHDMGNITAVGIIFAWIYSLTFLPAFVSLLPMKVKKGQGDKGLQKFLSIYADFVIAQRKPILFGTVLLAVFLLALVPKVELNDQWVEYFDESMVFRQDAEFGMDNLTGVYTIEYSVEAGEPGGISNPEYLENLERYSNWLKQQPEVTHVFTYSDIIKRLNKNMHGDDESWYKIPEERELAAQYLLLYELSLPYGLDLNDRINIDKSATRVTASLGNYTTREVRSFLDRSENWLKENTPQYMWSMPTGATVMFSFISERNIKSMLWGNLVAITAIAIILIISLRSFNMGMLSLIPNGLPILMAFGFWAILVGKLGMAAATVTTTSLGIVVDDTVHFLTKYLRARREKGLERPEAIKYAFETVGMALVVTTFILTIGFSVLMASTFLINFQMGQLTAMVIVIALFMDFTLLPAILLIGYKEKTKEGAKKDENVIAQAAE